MLAVIGAGGHGLVAAEAWASGGGRLAGFYDDKGGDGVLGTAADALAGAGLLHIGIGSNAARRSIAAGTDDARFPPVVHARAILSPSAAIGAGALIAAGAVVQAEARVGRHAIVNDLALVEHHCRIGDFVHLAPGVRLGGNVSVGEGAMIGLGAVVLPGVSIGRDAVIGAGAVVLRDVGEGATMVGNPARAVRA